MASPVLAYARRYGIEARRVAFSRTGDSDGSSMIFEELEEYCGLSPCSTLVVEAGYPEPARYCIALARFSADTRKDWY